jgi:tRNA (mo5U34)-methyltransferase
MKTTAPEGFDVAAFYEGIKLFQSWDIFPGVDIAGNKPVHETLRRLGFPSDLRGARVLDVGAWNGFFSFECVRRGASEVVALSPEDPAHTGFAKTARLLELDNVKYVQDSVYNIPNLALGKFDIVMLLGVIYHLRHPLLALDLLYDACSQWFFLDSPVIDDARYILPSIGERGDAWKACQEIPLVYYSQNDERTARRDLYNWYLPNKRALQDWLITSGFEIDQFDGDGGWAWVKARKAERAFEPGLEGFNPGAVGPNAARPA